MADLNEYFPGIKIRTLKSDLESLKESGGAFTQEKEVKLRKEDYLFQEEKQEAVIAPPVLEIRQTPSAIPTTPQQQKIGTIEQSIQDRPRNLPDTAMIVSEDTINPKLIWLLGGGLALIIVLSIGFWVIYPSIKRPIAVMPTPTPSPIESPVPTPSPIAPVLAFKTEAEKFPIILSSLNEPELIQKLKLEILLPETAGTLISFEPKQGSGEYFSGEDLIKILAPNALSSFKASIGKEYLILGYWGTDDNASLSLVLTIKPETMETAQSIVKSWESANMEEYFPVVFLPQPPEKRRTETFKSVKIGGVEARKIVINQQVFVYALVTDRLIISPSEEVFELIVNNLSS